MNGLTHMLASRLIPELMPKLMLKVMPEVTTKLTPGYKAIAMANLSAKRVAGFTLIEVVTVIVIIGVLASGVASFTKFSTQIYNEASEREQLISSTRFAIERLTREVRNALPNSLRVSANASGSNNTCLEFMPIIDTTLYVDVAISPEIATNTIEVVDINNFLNAARLTAANVDDINELSVVVYPLNPNDGYAGSSKLFGVSAFNTSNATITLDSAAQFPQDSPIQRLYVVDTNQSVKYCLQATQLTRQRAGNLSVLMAENINSLAFSVADTTLERNAMVQILFTLEKNNEQVVFNHEVQVINVP